MPKVPNYLCTSHFTEKKTRTMGKITEMLSNKLRARTQHSAQSHPASQIRPTCSFHSHLLSADASWVVPGAVTWLKPRHWAEASHSAQLNWPGEPVWAKPPLTEVPVENPSRKGIDDNKTSKACSFYIPENFFQGLRTPCPGFHHFPCKEKAASPT